MVLPLPLPPAGPRVPAPTVRQLALPLETAKGPPALAALGPSLPPRRVWRSLAPAMQATVRRAVTRLCQEVAQEVAHDAAADR